MNLPRFPAAAASQQKICLCMSVFPGRRRKSGGFEDSNANRSFPSLCRLCRSLRFKWLADGIIKKCLVRSPSAALLSCKERQSFPTSQSEGAARRVFCKNDRFKVIREIKVQNSAFFFFLTVSGVNVQPCSVSPSRRVITRRVWAAETQSLSALQAAD